MGWARILSGMAIGILLTGSVFGQTRDVDGRAISPFAPQGKASLLLFVQTDCPVSNSYAPEPTRFRARERRSPIRSRHQWQLFWCHR